MSNILRKIRLSSIKNNKFPTYLKYALGEIILVVIGILVALQIDGWREQKKERAEEQEYLIEIKKNLEADINLIEIVETEYEGTLSNIDTLHIYIKNSNNKTTDYSKLFNNALAVSYIPSFSPKKNGYDNLISAGSINQIQNQELMKKIASHYSTITYSSELITETLVRSSRDDIHTPIRKLIGKTEFLADLGYEYETTSISANDLSKNEALISGLVYKKIWTQTALKLSNEWKEKTITLIEDVEKEINEWK